MSYVATWMKGDEIVSEVVFDDVLEAQAHVLRKMPEFFEDERATSVKVWNNRTTFFQVEQSAGG